MAALNARRASEYCTLARIECPQPMAEAVKTSDGAPAGATRATRNAGVQREPRPANASTASGRGRSFPADGWMACTATQSQVGVSEESTAGLRNRYPLSPAGSHRDCGSASRRSPPAEVAPCPAAKSAPRAASSSIQRTELSPAR